MNGIQEVSGSIPLISTKEKTKDFILGLFVLCEKCREPLTSCVLIMVSGSR